jgi:hypothetical protein
VCTLTAHDDAEYQHDSQDAGNAEANGEVKEMERSGREFGLHGRLSAVRRR